MSALLKIERPSLNFLVLIHQNILKKLFYKFIWLGTLHCKDKMPKIWKNYSQERNIGASVPISTFMCLWANYIFPRWVCLFYWRKYVDRSWEYINRSQTHECGNRGWGCAIPRKGIYKRNCRCSVYQVPWYFKFFVQVEIKLWFLWIF